MGISCAVWQLAEETIQDLKADPNLIHEVVEELKEYNDELPDGEKILLDVDKSWAGLTFLLRRAHNSKFAGFLQEGGLEVGKEDLGYGPGRIFMPREVAQILSILKTSQIDSLRKGLNVQQIAAADVYPFSANEKDDEVFGYLAQHLEALVEFLEASVAMGRGLLIYLF